MQFLGPETAALWTGPAVPAREGPPWHDRRVDTEPLDITCPRCGSPAAVRFYGPCDGCRDELRAHLGGEQRAVEVAAYEPKMNVVPNAVATKD